MNKFNLIDTFFKDQNEYIDFLVRKSVVAIANIDASCMVELTKENGYYMYKITWLADGKFLGEYITPFRASQENVALFNVGCKILAERLEIYIETDNASKVPMKPEAFGTLTYKMEIE